MRGKILIVEDYTDWRELLSGLLQREGYEVKDVATLEQARKYIDQARDLDLAILDIRLVEIDDTNEEGMRLLSEIHERGGFTRVIMITGHGTMESQRKAFREFHAFDFFRKEQFDSDDFRDTVREAVEQATRERGAWKDKDYIRGRRYERWQQEHEP
ncbi:MAG: response regulator [Anaerolineae bacterium]|jgi:two-component system nitrogen regulation response regulator NtrX